MFADNTSLYKVEEKPMQTRIADIEKVEKWLKQNKLFPTYWEM